jgi:hypothetical protein
MDMFHDRISGFPSMDLECGNLEIWLALDRGCSEPDHGSSSSARAQKLMDELTGMLVRIGRSMRLTTATYSNSL